LSVSFLFQVTVIHCWQRRSERESKLNLKAAGSPSSSSGGCHHQCESEEDTAGLHIQQPIRSSSRSGTWIYEPAVVVACGTRATTAPSCPAHPYNFWLFLNLVRKMFCKFWLILCVFITCTMCNCNCVGVN
jgi:hypothetical protein